MQRVWSSPAQPAQKPPVVELLGQHVGPERGQPLVEAGPALGHQLEQRPVEFHDLVARRAQHEPGAAGRAPPPPPGGVDAPHADHPEVRVQHQVAFEAQEQMLTVGVDAIHRSPAQPLGPAVQRVTRVRSRDLRDRPPARGGSAARRRQSCRPRASSVRAHALSVSRRGPCLEAERRPAPAPSGEPSAGSPSTFSSATRLTGPRWTCSTSASSAGSAARRRPPPASAAPVPPRSRYRIGSPPASTT